MASVPPEVVTALIRAYEQADTLRETIAARDETIQTLQTELHESEHGYEELWADHQLAQADLTVAQAGLAVAQGREAQMSTQIVRQASRIDMLTVAHEQMWVAYEMLLSRNLYLEWQVVAAGLDQVAPVADVPMAEGPVTPDLDGPPV